MEPYQSVDPTSPASGVETFESKGTELSLEQAVRPNSTTRTPQASVSAALAAAHAEGTLAPTVRFPGENGGHSLVEMAQRDLDAALHLLADRAQYITGASGVAIALRRDGKNDMLCRASTGSNAPELGALLSAEFGLSGESVRTRQALRCDDAERDARVNHEVCRQLGIASVVVMPVVNDDGVLGVFELFSGKANAFDTRDLSAVQRLSEMVETAVRLARAAESLSERLRMSEVSAPAVVGPAEHQVLDAEFLDDHILEDSVLDKQEAALEVAAAEVAEQPVIGAVGADDLLEKESLVAAPEAAEVIVSATVDAAPQAVPPPVVPAGSPENVPARKALFWSAALNPASPAGRPQEPDQSHVPPVLRGLRKCEACGFPVSAGRELCVECEEKKWRGQLRIPRAGAPGLVGVSARVADQGGLGTSGAQALTENKSSAAPLEALRRPKASVSASSPAAVRTITPAVVAAPVVALSATVPAPKAEVRAFAAAAQSATVSTTVPSTRPSVVTEEAPTVRAQGSPAAEESKEVTGPVAVASRSAPETVSQPPTGETPAPDFVLSAGLEPSQSWLSANKYVLGVLVAVGAAVAAVFLLR